LARAAWTDTNPAAPHALATPAARTPQAFVALEPGADAQLEPQHAGDCDEKRPPQAAGCANDRSDSNETAFHGVKEVEAQAPVVRAEPGWCRARRDAKEPM